MVSVISRRRKENYSNHLSEGSSPGGPDTSKTTQVFPEEKKKAASEKRGKTFR